MTWAVHAMTNFELVIIGERFADFRHRRHRVDGDKMGGHFDFVNCNKVTEGYTLDDGFKPCFCIESRVFEKCLFPRKRQWKRGRVIWPSKITGWTYDHFVERNIGVDDCQGGSIFSFGSEALNRDGDGQRNFRRFQTGIFDFKT